jgi:hypothetical protein
VIRISPVCISPDVRGLAEQSGAICVVKEYIALQQWIIISFFHEFNFRQVDLTRG